jgi:hypothetical protein
MATRHVEGSRTSAPREDTPPPPAAAAAVPAAVPAAEYPEANTRSDEE